MGNDDPYDDVKVCHRADKINSLGQVSALCYKRPRPIKLGKDTWTNRDEAVTCKRCLKAMAERPTKEPQ